MLYGQKGTLDEWRAEIAGRATGNSRLILGQSLMFSGPIFGLFESEPIGIHLVSLSSTGKPTVTVSAGSVWGGGGRNGFAQSWRATSNGLEGIAKAHSGTALCLEEIGEVDAKEVGSIAYMLTENVDEVREYVSRRIKALMEQWGIDGDNGQVSRVAHRFAIVGGDRQGAGLARP